VLIAGKVIATGTNDGRVFVWDVQDGRKVSEVVLDGEMQGRISCLNWIGEEGLRTGESGEGKRELDVEFEVERYLPRVKAVGRKFVKIRCIVDFSDTMKLSHDLFGDGENGSGRAGKEQAVNMVFVGSESGHLELRHSSFISKLTAVSLEPSL